MSPSAASTRIPGLAGPIFALAIVSAAGCSIDAEPDFDSAVPQDRFLAIREAERTRDRDAIPDLIRQLSVDDPLARRAAIEALEAITGQRLGYDPDAGELERRRAVDRWIEWREQTGQSATEASS